MTQRQTCKHKNSISLKTSIEMTPTLTEMHVRKTSVLSVWFEQ